jgi:hypothetical protein
MKKLLVTFMVALFATLVLGQTKTEVKPADLPKCVKDYIMHNMKGSNIDKAFKIDNKGEITYSVTVMKGKEKHILLFDKNCNVSKKASPAENKTTEANPTKPPKPVPLPPVKNNEQTQPAQPKK